MQVRVYMNIHLFSLRGSKYFQGQASQSDLPMQQNGKRLPHISRNNIRIWPAMLAVLTLLLLVASACGDGDAEPDPVADPGPEGTKVGIGEGGVGGKLTVYSGRSEELLDPIIKQFADSSGVEVAVKYAGTAELAAILLEEGNNTPADLYFAQDPGGLGVVADMMRPLPGDILDLVPDWAQSPEGRWVGVSGRARVVVYNTEKLTEAELPDDIFDFIDPKWKDRIGWAPANGSFQTMVTGMRSLWGEEKTKQWLEGIKANKPKEYPKNTPIVAAAAGGEIDVGFPNHYYLYRFLAEEGASFKARNYHPRAGGPGALIMVAGAGILTESDNKEAAEVFLKFMLSPVAQQYFAGQIFEYPLVEGVKTDTLVVPLDQINPPNIDAKDLTDLEGTVELLRDVGVLP